MAANLVRCAVALFVVSLVSLSFAPAAEAQRPYCRFDGRLVMSNLVRELKAAKKYSTFLDGLRKTGLDKDLRDLFHCYEATVFAPTDAAFAGLSSSVKAKLSDKKVLREVLLLHIVKGKKSNAKLIEQKKGHQWPPPSRIFPLQYEAAADYCKARLVKVSSAGTKKAKVKAEGGVDEAAVVAADVVSLRVVVAHGVDDVILPKTLRKGDSSSLKPKKCIAWYN
ncbi:unnamed protein product [Closterium sp. Naga37s-1]|nr:unnamed protein product [Closterium sp. Naga37s-1]